MNRAELAAHLGKPARAAEEEDIQIALIKHLGWRLLPGIIAFHVPNGGKRSLGTAKRLKAMGVLSGVHDLVFLIPGPRVFTLELKFGKNTMTDEQEKFAMDIERIGGEWACAWTLDQALDILVAAEIIKPEAA